MEVDLRPVEGTVSLVDFVFNLLVLQRAFESSGGRLPDLVRADVLERLGRQLDHELVKAKRAVRLEYQIDDAKFQLFVIEYPSLDAASSAFKAYSSHLEKEAELLSTDGTPRGVSKTFRTGDKLTFIGIENQSLWGFWDVEKPEAAESILQNILPSPR